MVVLGGSMDAYSDDHHPWLAQVKQLVRDAARGRVPTLGICLGHQLAAVALGGAVQKNPRGQQIGVLEFGWTPSATADPLLGPVSDAATAVQWNNDIVVTAPVGTEVLARTPAGELQAARFAPSVWGVQSHPEAGEEIVCSWAENDRDSAVERGIDVDEYVAKVAAARDELRASWQPLATRFAALDREVARGW
jgi:GMP synthase (glutamine-hydrolysing)